MTEKQFKLYEHKDNYYILDNPDEHLDFIEMLGDALTPEEIVDLLNTQHETIEKQKKIIAENEKLIQVTYDELTKLRCIKKNLSRIKTQWDWIMESIQYD